MGSLHCGTNHIACCKASFFSNSSPFKQPSAALGFSSHWRGSQLKCAAAYTRHSAAAATLLEKIPDLYGLLGVSSAANAAEIKSSFRKMALRYHPDVCPSADKEECSRVFIQVQQAYEILSDPEQRAEYDHHLMHPTASFAAQDLHRRMSWHVNLRQETSEAWKLQWEAQLAFLPKRRRSGIAGATTWGARMRQTHS